MLNHGANGGILDFPAVQVHADLVTTFELALWFLGGHVKECASSSSSARTAYWKVHQDSHEKLVAVETG